MALPRHFRWRAALVLAACLGAVPAAAAQPPSQGPYKGGVAPPAGPVAPLDLPTALRAQGHDSAGGWRGAKQDLCEGGHRGPFIVKYPASRSSDAAVAFFHRAAGAINGTG